jgi:hydrogenase maturation protease
MTAEGPVGPLVVGLGSVDRGDDAVGPVVARAVGALGIAGVRVVEHEEPTSLLDVWAGHDVVVVVDAVRSGRPIGTLRHFETGQGRPALPESAWAGTGWGGTHDFGVGRMVELARALRRLPGRLVIVGIEAGRFDHGAPLSPAVAEAVDRAVSEVVSVLAGVPAQQPALPHVCEGVSTRVPGRAG